MKENITIKTENLPKAVTEKVVGNKLKRPMSLRPLRSVGKNQSLRPKIAPTQKEIHA